MSATKIYGEDDFLREMLRSYLAAERGREPIAPEEGERFPDEPVLGPLSQSDDGGETMAFIENLAREAVDPTSPELIRPNIREALDAWGDGSHPYVGDFLRAVLENNLTEAFGRADDGNLRTLHAIVAYVYNELPSPCHGSPEKVRAWQAERLAAREATK